MRQVCPVTIFRFSKDQEKHIDLIEWKNRVILLVPRSSMCRKTLLVPKDVYILLWSCQNLCDVLAYILKILSLDLVVSYIYKVGIPMSIICAPLAADLFVFAKLKSLKHLVRHLVLKRYFKYWQSLFRRKDQLNLFS